MKYDVNNLMRVYSIRSNVAMNLDEKNVFPYGLPFLARTDEEAIDLLLKSIKGLEDLELLKDRELVVVGFFSLFMFEDLESSPLIVSNPLVIGNVADLANRQRAFFNICSNSDNANDVNPSFGDQKEDPADE